MSPVNALGRLRTLTDPLGNATTYTRDTLGRVVQVTDANGHATAYDYDALGQLITVTDALSGTTAYAYDAAGNLTVITDANQSMTRFEYNFLNQLKREINPLNNTWEYWYDDAGRLTSRRDAMWHATYYDYDSNGRLAEISYGVTPATMHPVTFTYDLESNETQMCDALGCTTHVYDELGRPTSTTDWLGRTITRTYDAVGNFAGLTYPNGAQTQYRYNANDWLTMFIDPHADASLYTRNPLGQVTEIRHPNDTIAGFDYDEAGRLTGITNIQNGAAQPQSAYQYAMDKVGNRTQVIETRAAFDGSSSTVDLVHSYAYDALDRLIAASTDAPASATGYDFDAVGNRLSKTGSVLAPDAGVPELPVAPEPEDSAYTYNAANQLTAVSGQRSAVTLDYNANGDRIHETEVLTDGTTLLTDYAYDREDRLVGVTKTVSDSTALTVTMVATYTYDGYGRRAFKEVAESEVRNLGSLVLITYHASRITYLYDGLDIIGAQLEQNGVVTETYYYLAPSPITGLRRPVEMERLPNPATGFAGDRHWYQSDGLDSVVALTDESGDLISPFLYDEYGQMLAGTSELQVFAYTAQDYDVETGLYHFYARYYNPKNGVWFTQDTHRGQYQSPLSLHRYNYLSGNSTNAVDLLGFAECQWYQVGCHASNVWSGIKTVGGNLKETGTTTYQIVKNGLTEECFGDRCWATDEMLESIKLGDKQFDELKKQRTIKGEYVDTMEKLQETRQASIWGYRTAKGKLQLVTVFRYDPELFEQLAQLEENYYLSKLSYKARQSQIGHLNDVNAYRMMQAEAGLEIMIIAEDMLVSAMPIVGNVYSGYKAVSGYNPITGEYLDAEGRALEAFSAVAGLAQLDKIEKGGRVIKTLATVGKVADTTTKIYNVGTAVCGRQYCLGEELDSKERASRFTGVILGEVVDQLGPKNTTTPDVYDDLWFDSNGQYYFPGFEPTGPGGQMYLPGTYP